VTQITEITKSFRQSTTLIAVISDLSLFRQELFVTHATENTLHLSDLKQNQRGIIRHCAAAGMLKQKLLSMGFIPGTEIVMLRNAPLRDPIEIGIHSCLITIRRSEAVLLKVEAV
jgi:Fe2+ transport system protein FeoA